MIFLLVKQIQRDLLQVEIVKLISPESSSESSYESSYYSDESDEEQKANNRRGINPLESSEEENDTESETDGEDSQEEMSLGSELSIDEEEMEEGEDLNLDQRRINKFDKPALPRFPLKYGVTRDLSNLQEPSEFFNLMFSDALMENICLWTNQYAEKNRNRRRRESHQRKWEPITLAKLKAYFGVLILIPLCQKPRLHDYWSRDTLTSTPGIRDVFSRDEFFDIKRNVRYYNEDPFHKFRPIFAEVLDNTNELYHLPKVLALDESMVKFDGRSAFKVYMPQKPIKFGFKIYSVVPSECPIVLNMMIHDGQKRTLTEIVSQVMHPFRNKGHIVYMDRFYTMPKVVKRLEAMGIGSVGTCMKNRLQLNDQIKNEIDEIIKGEFLYFQSNDIMLTLYQDSKLVYLLSNVDQVKQTRVTRRKRKADMFEGSDQIFETVNVPTSVVNYNYHARDVDILDQYINYYMFSHKSMKWQMRLVIFLLEVGSTLR